MFDVYCGKCELRRLVFPGQVTGMRNDEAGIHVQYRCWCGEIGELLTGRAASAAPAPELAAAS